VGVVKMLWVGLRVLGDLEEEADRSSEFGKLV
jgi:hypothetical protein